MGTFKKILTLVMLLPNLCNGQDNKRFLQRKIGKDSFEVIHADKSIVNKRYKQFTFIGNVSMHIFNDTVICDSAVFHYKRSTITVFGHIKSIPPWKLNVRGCFEDGQEYNLKTGVVLCSGPSH